MKKATIFIGAMLLVVITAVATYIITASQYTKILKANSVTGKISEISRYLDEYYVGELDDKTLGDYAAAGMVQGTGDRWAYYIPADYYDEYEEDKNNAYVGIGITLVQGDDNKFTVKTVVDGGPAAKVGIQVGDVITQVAGQSTEGMTMDDVRKLVRGPVGESVSLTLERNGAAYTVAPVREEIVNDVAWGEMQENGIGYIVIDNFSEHAAEQTIASVESLRQQGAKALIFDVRGNPGGYQTELVKILDHLLPEGVIFKKVSHDGKASDSLSDAACVELPMAVLVDCNTYSAAEFFAAALQEYEWATVVGEKTTGKGNYQNAFRLSDGSILNFSIGSYFTPSGKSLTDVGITPDVPVTLTDAEKEDVYDGVLLPENDKQFSAAVTALSSKMQ